MHLLPESPCVLRVLAFQFPLLGFLLCIFYLSAGALLTHSALSIPFIGIFALHQIQSPKLLLACSNLSIPFIGIFALHLHMTIGEELEWVMQMPEDFFVKWTSKPRY